SEIDFSAPLSKDFKVRDATLDPVESAEIQDGARVHRIAFDVSETEQEIAPGITINSWTFTDSYMGPVLHGKLGDIFEITLKNNGTMGHS
ncbi:hypothetical protein IR117_01935, partial [Streptococcus danieliae]|nr:hypothetical protein [Streptococcus danieliae]